jgi:hypothetical protein
MADPEGARKAELHQKVETLCDRIEAGTLGLVQGADFLEKELMAQGKLTQGGPFPLGASGGRPGTGTSTAAARRRRWSLSPPSSTRAAARRR